MTPELYKDKDQACDLFSDNDQPLVEWEYLPPIGPRPPKGFVGLKNAGATCYMNSVLQQMFMIEPIRTYLLAAEGAADDFEEEENDKPDTEVTISFTSKFHLGFEE